MMVFYVYIRRLMRFRIHSFKVSIKGGRVGIQASAHWGLKYRWAACVSRQSSLSAAD